MYLNAGDLTERITIQAPPAGKGALGQRAGDWTDVCTVWAKPEPLSSREYFAAGTMQVETAMRFLIRFRTDITREMRAVWRGVPYALTGEPINVNGARVALRLMCAAGVRDGQ